MQQKDILRRDFLVGENGLAKANQSWVELQAMLVEIEQKVFAMTIVAMTLSSMPTATIQDLNISLIDTTATSLTLGGSSIETSLIVQVLITSTTFETPAMPPIVIAITLATSSTEPVVVFYS